MSNSITLRIKFQKTGAIRYIGHLDVMRFFQKCIRRAEIDICYTGGFSPHQIMSFAAPLSVGLESLGEYVDIEVHSVTSSADMAERLNRASVPGIRIVSVKRLPETAGNAMASVAAAEYTVSFRREAFSDAELQALTFSPETLRQFLAREEIPYTKEGKKGSRDINLREGIYRLVWEPEEAKFHMLLNASSSGNIKPAQVMDALFGWLEKPLPEHALSILRVETYTENPEPSASPKLIPMDDIGESFQEAAWIKN